LRVFRASRKEGGKEKEIHLPLLEREGETLCGFFQRGVAEEGRQKFTIRREKGGKGGKGSIKKKREQR